MQAPSQPHYRADWLAFGPVVIPFISRVDGLVDP